MGKPLPGRKQRVNARRGQPLYAAFTPGGPNAHRSFARRRATPPVHHRCPQGDACMLDIILLGLGVGLFALLAAYAAGCERV
jgi:hypothetical protein